MYVEKAKCDVCETITYVVVTTTRQCTVRLCAKCLAELLLHLNAVKELQIK